MLSTELAQTKFVTICIAQFIPSFHIGLESE